MRYSLHNHLGEWLGASDTAQGIADIAKPGTFTYDPTAAPRNRCVVWRREPGPALQGSPVDSMEQAMHECNIIVHRGN